MLLTRLSSAPSWSVKATPFLSPIRAGGGGQLAWAPAGGTSSPRGAGRPGWTGERACGRGLAPTPGHHAGSPDTLKSIPAASRCGQKGEICPFSSWFLVCFFKHEATCCFPLAASTTKTTSETTTSLATAVCPSTGGHTGWL